MAPKPAAGKSAAASSSPTGDALARVVAASKSSSAPKPEAAAPKAISVIKAALMAHGVDEDVAEQFAQNTVQHALKSMQGGDITDLLAESQNDTGAGSDGKAAGSGAAGNSGGSGGNQPR